MKSRTSTCLQNTGVITYRRSITVRVISNLVIIPNRAVNHEISVDLILKTDFCNLHPREGLMTGNQVQICSVGGKPLAVVIKAKNFLVRKRDATEGVSPAIVAVLVLIDVITEMYYIINRVL
jgi:hypothetical protein